MEESWRILDKFNVSRRESETRRANKRNEDGHLSQRILKILVYCRIVKRIDEIFCTSYSNSLGLLW